MDKIAELLVKRTMNRLNDIAQSEETEKDRQKINKHRRALADDIEAERMDRVRESWYYTY